MANLLLLDGSTFFLSQENGDVEPNQSQGFFFKDVRHLSEWRLLVDGEPLIPLTSRAVDYFSGRVVAAPEGKDPPLTVERDRFVTEGAHEDIVIANHSSEERLLVLDLRFASDFADVLEAERPGAYSSRTKIDVGARSVTLRVKQDGFRRATRLSFNRKGELKRDRVTFKITIEPQGKWKLCVDLTPIESAKPRRPLLRCDSFGAPEPAMPITLEEWLDQAPELEAGRSPARLPPQPRRLGVATDPAARGGPAPGDAGGRRALVPDRLRA